MENISVTKFNLNQNQNTENQVYIKKVDLLQYKIMELESEKKVLLTLLDQEKEINQKRTAYLTVALHNLKSPLTSIQLSTSVIQHYYDRLDQQKMFAHLDKIKTAVTDFTILLNNFLLEESVETTKL